jgi:protein-S-isoprenylcysteine O-methyltransferase Ste14
MHLRTVPAVFTAWWLFAPIVAVLIAMTVRADKKVRWKGRRTPGLGELLLGPALGVIGIVSAVVFNATFPRGRSLIWPALAVVIMALSLPLRFRAMSLLGDDFNGDLETRNQLVVDRGPYAVVRHPGYVGTALFLIGFVLLFAYWPPLLVVVAALAVIYRRRIAREEPLNRAGIVGYEQYARRVRWRMIPGIW